jgi:hypothetical protein
LAARRLGAPQPNHAQALASAVQGVIHGITSLPRLHGERLRSSIRAARLPVEDG